MNIQTKMAMLVLLGVSIVAGLALADTSGGPGAGVVPKGPCSDWFVTGGNTPPSCENVCYFWCSDPSSDITYEHANCDNAEGACTRTQSSKPDKIKRRCECGGGLYLLNCASNGTYPSGSESVLVCAG